MISIIPITMMGNCIRMRTYILEYISKVYAHLYLMGTCIRMRAYILEFASNWRRAKRARHSQVCSIENRGYIYYGTCNFSL